MNVLAQYFGRPVYVLQHLGPRPRPNRVYLFRGWMRGTKHHDRIQKKWNKRYGTTMRDDILTTPGGIYMSPQNYAKLKARVAEFQP